MSQETTAAELTSVPLTKILQRISLYISVFSASKDVCQEIYIRVKCSYSYMIYSKHKLFCFRSFQ